MLNYGKSIEVCPDCTFKTIKEAIRSAQSCDSIIVGKGVYHENKITINKPLTVIGKEGSIVDGGGEHGVFLVVSDEVSIEGLTIRNVQADYLEEISGIRVRKASDFNISNNTFINTFFAIYLEHCENGSVTDNFMQSEAEEEASSGNAVHAWYCENLYIAGNEAYGHRDGIYFEFVDSSEIVDNYMHDNLRYGLHFMFSNDDHYHQNTFEANGAGVAVMFSKRIIMEENRFLRNRGMASYGLLLKEISDGEIRQNNFRENTVGIFVEGSNRINYLNNTLVDNGWAIKVSGGCIANNIQNNNFIGNSFDMTFAGKVSNNTIQQNYWSAYTGYDLDRDTYGDVPYRPVKLFNYIVQQTPEAIVLLRSLFVDIINFSESVSPIFTPKDVVDPQPRMLPLHTKIYQPI
jgi:nitrous oxidase accessory protein